MSEQKAEPAPVPEWMTHHPFCNFFSSPREGCSMCERFYARFGERTAGQILKEFYPDAVVIR